MRRRTWAILAALVAGGVVAAVGAVIATGLGGDDTARPTGTETILRIEPASEEVACGSGPAVVYVYLDDLASRPSPRQPDVSYGLAAFDSVLRYDPAILRIAAPAAVQLNARLDMEDADSDGVVRSYIPLVDIDDGAGWAALGAASFVPSSQGPEDNREEGLDPVAKGEPILLMTVRFLPVGHGTVALTFEPAGPRKENLQVFDPSGQRYEPVVVKGASVTVAGGDCPPGPFATPRPTPEPTHTPYVPPTPDIPTPVQLTPTPGSAIGRTDCPKDWAGYRDPDGHFSLCYPTGWTAVTAPPDADFGTTFSLRTAETVSFSLYWKPSSYFDAPDFQDRCGIVSWEGAEQTTLTIAGRTVTGCVGYETLHAADAPPLRATFAELPIGRDRGFMVLFLTQAEGPAYSSDRDLASSVLDSIRLGE